MLHITNEHPTVLETTTIHLLSELLIARRIIEILISTPVKAILSYHETRYVRRCVLSFDTESRSLFGSLPWSRSTFNFIYAAKHQLMYGTIGGCRYAEGQLFSQ